MEEENENQQKMEEWVSDRKPHKIPVPTQYRQAAKILKQIVEEGKSFKELVYNNKHIKTGSTVALLTKIQANEIQLEQIMAKTDILQNIPNIFLAKILVAELIFGRGQLNGHSKPVECVLSNHDKLKEALAELGENPNQQSKLQQYKEMGKRNKKSKLNVVADANDEESSQSDNTTNNQEDNDALIPYHTKQASFALLFLLFFSVLMFTLPFLAFYGTQMLLRDYFHIDGFQNTCCDIFLTKKNFSFIFLSVPRYIRLNTILIKKTEAKEYLEREGWRLIESSFETYDDFLEAVKNLDDENYLKDFHIKNLFVFPSSSRKYWATNPLVQEGKFLLQDKASCLPAVLLDPPHKSTVIDMCAAPGTKTTHLASIMKNKGKIYAIEMNVKRYQTLLEMVEGTGATIIQPINKDVLEVKDEDVPKAEYILLDPSCSGSGMLNRFESEVRNKDAGRLFKLAGLQHKLLIHAMTSFPNVVRIVYSTCSIYTEENEEVVLSVLRKVSDFKLVDAGNLIDSKWKNFGSEKVYPGLGSKVLYARTSDDLSNGFFVSVFERCQEGEVNEFYAQKQENIKSQKKNEGNPLKRKKDNQEVTEENSVSEVEVKKPKKKWKNKGYNQ
ncbi:CLUMA_CG001390, isoform B [Clunio marinus]|nr:CLUMA_CG001390, isoform B [Clunio marinus]